LTKTNKPAKKTLVSGVCRIWKTKFVAANTLIGLDKPAQTLLRNPEIEVKEIQPKELRQANTLLPIPEKKNCNTKNRIKN
jgi:hypothetical protein